MELRAPDPTLVDLHAPVAVDQHAPRPAVAHRMEGPGFAETSCGIIVTAPVNSGYAAWFAVPCRDCFPDAPPPGSVPCVHDGCDVPDCTGWRSYRRLAWQVSS